MRNLIRLVFLVFIFFFFFFFSYNYVHSYKIINTNDKKVALYFKNKKEIDKTSKYDYIGVLEIPKIGLKRGFVNPMSINNNINENITILKPVEMPNEDNSVFILAAHSGNSNVSFFKNLYKLNYNDDIYVYYNNHKYEYIVVKYYTENKNGNINIKDNTSNKKLVLTTCSGFNRQIVYIAYFRNCV